MIDFCVREFFLGDIIWSGFNKGCLIFMVFLGIRDELLSFMKRREVIFMVLVVFLKVFDIVCFKMVIIKLYYFGFLKNVFEWLVNYLCDRRYYV